MHLARTELVPLGRAPVFTMPRAFVTSAAEAQQAGMRDGNELGQAAPGDAALAHAAAQLPGPPPGNDVTRRELVELHAIADRRTEQGVDAAEWYADHADGKLWKPYLRVYEQRHGHDQAKLAERLLERSIEVTLDAIPEVKNRYNRPRPFETDPTLPIAVHRPSDQSYPSGHAAVAMAAATVLRELLPDLDQSLLAAATNAAWSRMYGGVHYPSDVLAGARLGAAVGAALLLRPDFATLRPHVAAA